MEKYVITINRQFGSLGRRIARELSELLNIEYYDRDIVDTVAKNLDMPVSQISNEEEKAKGSFLKMKFPLGNGTSEIQDYIFQMQQQLICNISDRESCIIVGRCSDYILKSNPNIIRVFIFAPYEARLYNCIQSLHMKPEAAKKMIAEVDKARDAYHLRYAHYLPSDFNHNDILLDSSKLGVSGTARHLSTYVQSYLQHKGN